MKFFPSVAEPSGFIWRMLVAFAATQMSWPSGASRLLFWGERKGHLRGLEFVTLLTLAVFL